MFDRKELVSEIVKIAREDQDEMDRYLRVAVLEGIAGVPAGSWNRSGGIRGLSMARDYFETSTEILSEDWFNMKGFRIPEQMVNAAASITKKVDIAEDLVQDLVAGLKVKGRRDYIYEVGEYLKKETSSDQTITVKNAIGILRRKAAQRAAAYKRKKEVSYLEDSPAPGREDGWASTDSDVMVDRIIETLSGNLDSDLYKLIRRQLVTVFQTDAPERIKIFDYVMANPTAKDTEVARALGKMWTSKWEPSYLAPDQQGRMVDGVFVPWEKYHRDPVTKQIFLSKDGTPRPKVMESAGYIGKEMKIIRQSLMNLFQKFPKTMDQLKNYIELERDKRNMGYAQSAAFARNASDMKKLAKNLAHLLNQWFRNPRR